MFTENFSEKIFFLYLVALRVKWSKANLELSIYKCFVELDDNASFNLRQIAKYYWRLVLPKFRVIRWKNTITLVPDRKNYARMRMRQIEYEPLNNWKEKKREKLNCENLFLYSGSLNSRLDILDRIVRVLPEGTLIKQHPNVRFRTDHLDSDDNIDILPLEYFDLSGVRQIFFFDTSAVCNLEQKGRTTYVFFSVADLVIPKEITDFVSNNKSCKTYDLDIFSAPLG